MTPPDKPKEESSASSVASDQTPVPVPLRIAFDALEEILTHSESALTCDLPATESMDVEGAFAQLRDIAEEALSRIAVHLSPHAPIAEDASGSPQIPKLLTPAEELHLHRTMADTLPQIQKFERDESSSTRGEERFVYNKDDPEVLLEALRFWKETAGLRLDEIHGLKAKNARLTASTPAAPERNTENDLEEPGAVRTKVDEVPEMARPLRSQWIRTVDQSPTAKDCQPFGYVIERWLDGGANWIPYSRVTAPYWMPLPELNEKIHLSEQGSKSDSALSVSSPILQHVCTFCGTMCHGPSTVAAAAGQEEGEWEIVNQRTDCFDNGWTSIADGAGKIIVDTSETLAKTVVAAHNTSLREKEEVKTREIEDAFIERMAERLKAGGVEWSDCDGDDDPAVIIGNYFAARLAAEPEPSERKATQAPQMALLARWLKRERGYRLLERFSEASLIDECYSDLKRCLSENVTMSDDASGVSSSKSLSSHAPESSSAGGASKTERCPWIYCGSELFDTINRCQSCGKEWPAASQVD